MVDVSGIKPGDLMLCGGDHVEVLFIGPLGDKRRFQCCYRGDDKFNNFWVDEKQLSPIT